MPGLLDLPVELIEEIYQQYCELIEDDDSSTSDSPGHMRLVCRYLEHTTRRLFRQHCFSYWVIRRPQGIHIKKFCAIAKVPDLAKTFERFEVWTGDDGTKESEALGCMLRWGGADIFSDEQFSTQVDILDELLPSSLSRHRDALLAALRACRKDLGLEISDYHFLEADTPLTAPKSQPRNVRLVNDFNEGKHVCDVTSTFTFILSLMAEAGMTPSCISVNPLNELKMQTGLTNAVALVRWKQALVQVKTLELVFIDDWRNDVHSAEEA